ncbi:hypothetical protein BTO20_13685 [Mycobacterium dioxanotrophicus]|jgi:hypothetical protein|uniref:DUF2784 domain-containing protein n=1 Tax=Mycobacterium dioxanotrophicus TaxID=482462 RepID=A0A1Y0C315_9MYCO|nr:DUF2784 domain-containing protein [Mycobacterium dioxanotrophicus]ART69497.1 hypothetical protein BTO20_13685 [Mycobacterium dioxanotrophicus]
MTVYSALVALTVAVHFGFIAYLLLGGFIACRWPRTIALHVAAVLWGLGSVALDLPCPLTALERWARARAGMPPLPSAGFIAHYITGVLYPASWIVGVQAAVFALVVASWTLVLIRRRRSSPAGPSGR